MKIIDVFVERAKHKLLNNIIKPPKGYDWYLGIIVKDYILDEEKFDIIFEKSKKHLKILKILSIDNYSLLLFAIDPIPFANNLKGIVNSISRYLDCSSENFYKKSYFNFFKDVVFDAWGKQKYFYITNDEEKVDLKILEEG